MPFNDVEISFLKSFGVLQDIPEVVILETIGRHADCRDRMRSGDLLFEAGQVKSGLYLIAHGTIESFTVNRDGKEHVFDFARAGDTLAEETMFNEGPLQYSARSLTQSAVLRLPNAVVSAWVVSYPMFARRMMTLVAKRICFFEKDLLILCAKGATARLVCYLICHFDQAPRTLDGSYILHFDVIQEKIASRLGMTGAQVSRSFRELRERGLIISQAKDYFIPDVSALSHYVCPRGCEF